MIQKHAVGKIIFQADFGQTICASNHHKRKQNTRYYAGIISGHLHNYGFCIIFLRNGKTNNTLYILLFCLIFFSPLAQHTFNKFHRISSCSGNLCALTPVRLLLCQIRYKFRTVQSHRTVDLVPAKILEQFQHGITADQFKQLQITVISCLCLVTVNIECLIDHLFIYIVQIDVDHSIASLSVKILTTSSSLNPVVKRNL